MATAIAHNVTPKGRSERNPIYALLAEQESLSQSSHSKRGVLA
jgi:hypothetical protein